MKKLLALFVVLAIAGTTLAQGDSINVWTTNYFPVIHHEAKLTIFYKNTGNFNLYNFTIYLSSPQPFQLLKVRSGNMADSLALPRFMPHEDSKQTITVYNNLKPLNKGIGTLLNLIIWMEDPATISATVVFDGQVYYGFETRALLFWNGWDVSSEFNERMIREEIHETLDTLNFTTYLTIPLKPKLSGFIINGDSLVLTAADQLSRSVAYFREGGSGLEVVVKLKYDPRKFYRNFQYWQVYKLLPPFTNVESPSTAVPIGFSLEQNFPNPFNFSTTIRYQIPYTAYIMLDVINIRGELVKTLANTIHQAGLYTTVWDGLNNGGNEMPSGVYLVRLTMGNFAQSKRIVFLK
ncbi:MAG: FlgD immunoglobulin-like domain containing protein [Patescibacteria group bacterium]